MFERFYGLSIEEKKNLKIDDFTVSEIRVIIEETVFAKEVDPLIAELRFIRNCTIERITDKIGYEQERSVSHRLDDIKARMYKTILKLI